MRSDTFQNRIRLLAAQSTRDYVPITTQKRLLFAVLPDIDEQERIAYFGDSFTHNLDVETGHYAKLRVLKSGLMHDLLTGRVRIPEFLLKKAAATT